MFPIQRWRVHVNIQSRKPIGQENHVVSAKNYVRISISSRVFGAYSMTRIFYKYAHLPTLFLFSHFHLQSQHTLSSVTSRENTLTLSISTNRVNTPFLLFTFDFHNQLPSKCIVKVKLATLVKGDPKAPFSRATTPRCRGGRYSFPWIAPLYP